MGWKSSIDAAAYNRNYRAQNRERLQAKNRRDKLLKRYGITPQQWERQFDAQGRVCANCGSDDPGQYWHTDHDHDSGAFRGIVCQSCNHLIGAREKALRLGLAERIDAYLANPPFHQEQLTWPPG